MTSDPTTSVAQSIASSVRRDAQPDHADRLQVRLDARDQSTIAAFPARLTRRGRRRKANAAKITALPAIYNRQHVANIAATMCRKKTEANAEKYLGDQIEQECRRLTALGLPEEVIDAHCWAFAREVIELVKPAISAPVRRDDDRLPVKFVASPPKVVPLPGRYCGGATAVKNHVDYLFTRDNENAQVHIGRNLRAIRMEMEELGIAEASIQSELAGFNIAVWQMIWQRVMDEPRRKRRPSQRRDGGK